MRTQPACNTTIRPFRVLGSAALALSALSGTSQAQFTFSFDFHGPSRSGADCAGVFMSEGDIMTPCTAGTPAMPIVPGPLPTPMVAITGGVGGLGLPAYAGCVGTPPGVPCAMGIEVDALSYGVDTPMIPNMFNAGSPQFNKSGLHFSVDEFAVGLPTGIAPAVFDESAIGDAAADVFRDIGLVGPPPIAPFAGGPPGNHADVDGDGRPGFPTYWAYPGTGLIEPTAPGLPPDLGDNLDALDVDGVAGLAFPVYYSLDSAFMDPRNGFFGSGSAAAMGFSGADVLVTPFAGAAPLLFAPAGALGLDLIGGPDSDDLDALILVENGSGVHEVSGAPYDWLAAGGSDMLLFSVREGSAVIGAPDSFFGIPIQAGDILSAPLAMAAGGVSPFPMIWIAAENIGLEVSAARGGPGMFGDDLDGLDFTRQLTLIHQEYCFGDGGLAGCTVCPCGNDMPTGNQTGCMNSAGTGARLETSGVASASFDTLRFEVTGATPTSFAMLTTGSLRLPLAGPCPPGSGTTSPVFDGLRCFGGGFLRYGARPTDAAGDVGVTNAGWGAPDGPGGGLIAAYGFAVCSTRQWQVLYRDSLGFGCGTGINTTQGVQTLILP